MKCDQCDKPAVVHEVLIRNGTKTEVHLCAEHATASGITLPTPTPLNELLSHIITPAKEAAPRSAVARPSPACPSCNLTFAQFRGAGTLGCPQCYQAFGERLEMLIQRAHAGAVSHVGKTPCRCGGDLDVARLRQRLVRELDEAVAAEQYERAARLRDRLLTLTRRSATNLPDAGATAERGDAGTVEA